MWLTPHFPDLCRSSCIYNAMAPTGPCPPLLAACVWVYARHMLLGVGVMQHT